MVNTDHSRLEFSPSVSSQHFAERFLALSIFRKTSLQIVLQFLQDAIELKPLFAAELP
jgi:hypothetical protein